MRRAHCTFLLLSAFIFVAVSKADQRINKFQPHVHGSFRDPGACSYTVVISTSCLSPKYTTDQISITFGDAFGNQVYDPKLVNPFTTTFEQCSTNTFQVTGSCSLQICYVYFYRNGTVGWIPQSVEIYGSFSTPAVFFFNSTTVPEGEWYGISKCQHTPTAPPPSSALRPQIIPGWFSCLILGFLATSIFSSY
ncbi:EMBRYO-SPECIFIC PROTEIN ATS3B [Salix viminalis]|uniref:EMBRYO-SPECIFIC PROTEIN ATS3B n=1 Tax=Salix viminalis TaxID=40686 RepID=A0A9Q0SG66_SALVM|nr:EMBRYO-SPECIFIC PROTEIN ATS3B [Salix viminalis]